MLFDRDKIEKVFYNLLSNAFKFTPDGGRIALRVETTEQEGQYYVRITVRDTGCGIRSEEQTRIFERFYQTGNIPHEQAEGSGIGLMLTKDYVRLHGGEKICIRDRRQRELHLLPLRRPAVDAGRSG